MIKALRGKQVILGLSDANLDQLKAGKPILFNMKEMGLPDIEVFIFNGKDEQSMFRMLADMGVIHPTKTKFNHPRGAKDN